MNALEKFREYWGELTWNEKSHMWSILTSLRGPDSSSPNAEEYKAMTTCPIRGIVFCDDRHDPVGSSCDMITGTTHMSMAYSRVKPLSAYRRKKLKKNRPSSGVPYHFFAHFEHAIKSLYVFDEKAIVKMFGRSLLRILGIGR